MIDNRPKVHHRKHHPYAVPRSQPHTLLSEPQVPERAEAVPAPLPEPSVATKSMKTAKTSHAKGLGGLLGNLTGGLGNLGGGLLGGLGGGGLGSILPLLLVVGALSPGIGLPGILPGLSRPAASKGNLAAIPAPLPAPPPPPEAIKPEPQTGRKPRRTVRTETAPPQPVAEPEPEPPPSPPARQPQRAAPKPMEIKNLLGDLSAYLPGSGSSSAARISKIIGIADELKSLGSEDDVYTASAPADPLDRHIGLLNVLSRNMPGDSSSNLGRASQVLSIVNTLRGSGQSLGGLLGPMMRPQAAPSAPEMKNITPQQADGIKNTVNRLLSGMDDKQKNELLDRAKDFLGKN